MASNVELTAKGPGGASSITLYKDEATAIAAGSKLIYLQALTGRPSPWEIIQYPGSNAIRAKFMGAKPRFNQIIGAVLGPTDDAMRIALKLITNMNKTENFYTVTAGAVILHDAEGMVVEDVSSVFLGDGTGPVWRFQINLLDLGTT